MIRTWAQCKISISPTYLEKTETCNGVSISSSNSLAVGS